MAGCPAGEQQLAAPFLGRPVSRLSPVSAPKPSLYPPAPKRRLVTGCPVPLYRRHDPLYSEHPPGEHSRGALRRLLHQHGYHGRDDLYPHSRPPTGSVVPSPPDGPLNGGGGLPGTLVHPLSDGSRGDSPLPRNPERCLWAHPGDGKGTPRRGGRERLYLRRTGGGRGNSSGPVPFYAQPAQPGEYRKSRLCGLLE